MKFPLYTSRRKPTKSVDNPARSKGGPLVWPFVVALVIALCMDVAPVQAFTPLRLAAPDLPGASGPGGTGRDAEIVSKVLEMCGYDPVFTVYPFMRHIKSFEESNTYDAVITVPVEAGVTGYSSVPYIHYQNGVVYPSRLPHIDMIDDLKGLKLVTFSNGEEILDLHERADHLNIDEVPNHWLHSKMLAYRRVDAILTDGLVAAEINRVLGENHRIYTQQLRDLRFSPIFEPTPHKMIFRHRKDRDAFETCYARAQARGLVERINRKYARRLRAAFGGSDPGSETH